MFTIKLKDILIMMPIDYLYKKHILQISIMEMIEIYHYFKIMELLKEIIIWINTIFLIISVIIIMIMI